MRIFVAGKYGASSGLSLEELEANVQKAIEAARELIKKGHTPYIPHLMHYVDRYGGDKLLPELEWQLLSIKWLEQCEAIYMLPNFIESEGARYELAIAMARKMPVYYKLEDIKEDK